RSHFSRNGDFDMGTIKLSNFRASTPSIQNADNFLSYVVVMCTYFESNLKVKIWNHFNTTDTLRTNNNQEGYNLD
ncbi:unnamed protein product, partial [Brachionus calyciflorus]